MESGETNPPSHLRRYICMQSIERTPPAKAMLLSELDNGTVLDEIEYPVGCC